MTPKSNLALLVMELMDDSLTQFVKKCANTGKYPHLCSRSAWATISLQVLRYIHTKYLVHRDLCSGNVLLRMTSSLIPLVKISDFSQWDCLLIQMTSTSLWQLWNTEAYLPPETHKIAFKWTRFQSWHLFWCCHGSNGKECIQNYLLSRSRSLTSRKSRMLNFQALCIS